MNNTYKWYSQLIKPSWAPPAWLFAPVWTFLYLLIIISFGYSFFLFYQDEITFFVILPFILNIFFNLIFTPLQFKLRNNLLAALDVILVLVTLIWAMLAIRDYSDFVFYAQIPYLLWVSFASILQITITYLNWNKK